MLDRFQTAQTICQVRQQAVAPEARCGVLMPCAVRASVGASELCVCSSRLGVTCHREEVVVVHRCGNVRVVPGPPRAWACTAAGRLACPPSGISLSLEGSRTEQSDGARLAAHRTKSSSEMSNCPWASTSSAKVNSDNTASRCFFPALTSCAPTKRDKMCHCAASGAQNKADDAVRAHFAVPGGRTRQMRV